MPHHINYLGSRYQLLFLHVLLFQAVEEVRNRLGQWSHVNRIGHWQIAVSKGLVGDSWKGCGGHSRFGQRCGGITKARPCLTKQVIWSVTYRKMTQAILLLSPCGSRHFSQCAMKCPYVLIHICCMYSAPSSRSYYYASLVSNTSFCWNIVYNLWTDRLTQRRIKTMKLHKNCHRVVFVPTHTCTSEKQVKYLISVQTLNRLIRSWIAMMAISLNFSPSRLAERELVVDLFCFHLAVKYFGEGRELL